MSGSEQNRLVDYVRVVYKRRWIALAVLALVVSAAALHSFMVTPIYEARAQLLIEDEKQNVIIFKDAVETANPSIEYYQTQYKILQSRTLAEKALDELKLWDHPEFTKRPLGLSTRLRLAVINPVRRGLHKIGIGGAPPEPVKATQAQRVQAFLSRLTVSPVKSSRLVDLLFQAADPALAAKAANTLAHVYIEQNREAKFTASKDASDWLSRQLAEQRDRVQASEAELQRYRERNDALSVEDRENIVVQKLSDLNSAATKMKTERIQKEGLYKQLAAVRNNPAALGSFPLILANPTVQQLRAELTQLRTQQAQLADNLGTRHPDMVKVTTAIDNVQVKIDAEVGMIVESLRNDFVTAQELERNLTGALEAQKAEALALNRKEIGYGVLERDATTNRQIFQSLLQRARETGITGDLHTNNIRIVDQAQTPRSPVWPRKSVNLFFALCGGTVLAIGLTFFLDYIDGRVKTPDEIRGRLDLSFLGLVPKVRSKSHAGNPLLNNGVPAGFAEAFRTIRTNVLFSNAVSGGSIVITSTGPSEGKTVVAANLSLALAMTGKRVLLVDADMRRPRVHQVFDLPRLPGLSELLVGQAKASEAIRPSGESGLWVLPAGTAPNNPAELLSSNRFNQFLAALCEHYDWVIIDSPPVMAVTDAAVLAHTASAVLFVVAAEQTHRANALAALEQLEAANANFVGAVLNGVDLERNGFLYSDYYRREYGAYYQGVPGVIPISISVDTVRATVFQRAHVMRWVLDPLVLGLAFLVATMLRFDFVIPRQDLLNLPGQMAIVVILQCGALYMAGVQTFIWRYIGLVEAKAFTGAILRAAVPLALLRLTLPHSLQNLRVPFSIIIIDSVLAVGGTVGLRLLRRASYERRRRRTEPGKIAKPVLLIGAGRAGRVAAHEIQRRTTDPLDLKGFVDDDPNKLRSVIDGVKVIGTTADLPRLVRELGIDHVVISIARASRDDFRRITRVCDSIPIKVRVIPALHEILDGRLNISAIRDVQIEDLLGRNPVHLEVDEIGKFLAGRVVLLTGAGGSIGSELGRQLARFGPALVLLVERAEFALFTIHRELQQAWPSLPLVPLVADVGDEERMRAIYMTYRPQVVLHAAAHKHVPMMETNPFEAVKNNVLATHRLGQLAGEYGVEVFVMISTDKAVRPTSVMGATKRVAELVVQDLNRRFDTRYVAVRFGNVIGSAGSVITIFRDQISRGGPVTVTHPDMVRYFMTIPEAAQLVLQAGTIGQGGEIFILDMGEPVRIVDLARDIITLSGLKPNEDIQIVYSGQRPGEKLFEELELTGEEITKTRHPKIFIGRIAAYPADAVHRALERLGEIVRCADQDELYRYLNDLLPGAQLDSLGHTRADSAAAGYGAPAGYARNGAPATPPQLPHTVQA